MTLSPGREPLFGLFAVVFTVVRTYFALFAILAITSFLFRQSNAKIARKKQAVTDRTRKTNNGDA